MRTLHMNEVIRHIDQSVQKKEKQREQLHQLWTSINNVIGVESFKGETAGAIKDNLVQAQSPVVLMLYYAFDQWITKLTEFKQDLLNFEEESSIYNEQFVTQDVKSSLDRLEQLTLDIAGQINTHYGAVSHLAAAKPVNDLPFIQNKMLLINHLDRTNEDFDHVDKTHKESLTSMSSEISNLKSLLGQIKSWQSEGKSFDAEALRSIDDFIVETDVLFKMTASGMDLAVKNGDESVLSQIAVFLDKIGKLQGGVEVAKGAVTVGLLLSKTIEFKPDGNQFRIVIKDTWRSATKYSSLAARMIKSSFVLPALNKKFNRAPANVLRWALGFKNNTSIINIQTLLNKNHEFLKFTTTTMGDKVSSKFNKAATLSQLDSPATYKSIARKIPGFGPLFSVVVNGGEFFNERNDNKTEMEKMGRFSAGIAADIGVTALTTGGAALGTMICPGIGTIIGGAIGAGIGIGLSIKFDNEIKDAGEKAFRFVENTVNDTVDKLSETVDDGLDFVSSWFK